MPSPRTSKPRKSSPAEQSPEIAVLSDIHSNLHALYSVLEECKARKITRFLCLGDIVGYGAYPAECLKLVRSLRCPTVIGNHDFYAGSGKLDDALSEGARIGLEYSKKQLSASARKWLRELPETVKTESFTIVHASLEEPLEWHYILDSSEARLSLVMQETPVCFFGHTHVPKLFAGSEFAPQAIR